MNSDSNIFRLNERLADGTDSIAFELDRKFRQRLCSMVNVQLNRIHKRRQDPEDIVQSVFRSFFNRAAKNEFYFESPNGLWPLLRQMAKRKLLKKVQKDTAAKRNILLEEPSDTDPELEAVEAKAHFLAEALDLALKGFDAPMPEIFRLQLYGYSVDEVVQVILDGLEHPYPLILQRKLEGRSEQQIAEELGCLRGKIRYRLERIQTRLAELLGDVELQT